MSNVIKRAETIKVSPIPDVKFVRQQLVKAAECSSLYNTAEERCAYTEGIIDFLIDYLDPDMCGKYWIGASNE